MFREYVEKLANSLYQKKNGTEIPEELLLNIVDSLLEEVRSAERTKASAGRGNRSSGVPHSEIASQTTKNIRRLVIEKASEVDDSFAIETPEDHKNRFYEYGTVERDIEDFISTSNNPEQSLIDLGGNIEQIEFGCRQCRGEEHPAMEEL